MCPLAGAAGHMKPELPAGAGSCAALVPCSARLSALLLVPANASWLLIERYYYLTVSTVF
jgi:hypothetical protein